ncbi:hypothetical protein RIF29_26155 [Crotalaria pallida]|uniref:LOB domain-containing protein n=1 Tax=Crotalaria pallida TaxID=3830 RepID=A0AAN9EN11_CROPI
MCQDGPVNTLIYLYFFPLAFTHFLVTLQNELSYLQARLAKVAQSPPPLQQASMAATMPTTYDLSTLFGPMAQSPWIMMQQRAMDPCYQYVGGGTSASGSSGASSRGDEDDNLHAFAQEFMQRNGSAPPAPCAANNANNATNASPSHPDPK